MVRRNKRPNQIQQKSKRIRSKTIYQTYDPDESVLFKKLKEKYITHHELLKNTTINRNNLTKMVGERCTIQGIILDIVYRPEKALFLKQVTLGSVTVINKKGIVSEIDHINIPLDITTCDRIGPKVLAVGKRVEFESTVRFYNKKAKTNSVSRRKFKRDKTDLSVGMVQDLQLIPYKSHNEPLSLYLKNRIELWEPNPKERKQLYSYVMTLPNNGKREEFVQSISNTTTGHKYINYGKLKYFMRMYYDSTVEEILRKHYNFHHNPAEIIRKVPTKYVS